MQKIAFQALTGVASAAQGALAATAVQPAALTAAIDGVEAQLVNYTPINTTLRRFVNSAGLLAATVAEDTIIIGDAVFQANVTGMHQDAVGKKFGPALYVTPRMFGAVGDGYADDKVACQSAWDYAADHKIMCLMEGLQYNCSESVFPKGNLILHGQGAKMYITAWPVVGGFINNVRPVAADRAMSNIYMRDLITDGSKLPHYFQEYATPIQASNLLLSQSDWTNAAWTKSGVSVIANSVIGPYGNLIADKITEDGTTGVHLASQTTAAVLIDQMIVASCYVRGTGDRTIALAFSGTAMGGVTSRATFDLTLNKVIFQSSDLYVAEVQKVGDTGWSLITIAKRSSAAGTYSVHLNMADATGTISYAGNNASYLYFANAFSNVAEAGNNCNLGPEFAWGASNILIENCTAQYCRVGIGGGTGGGGLGGELGLKDVRFKDCTVQHCYRGLRIAGNAVDTLSTGATEEAGNVVFENTTIRNCGTAIFGHSVGHTGDDESNIKFFDVTFINTLIEACGHNAFSPVDWVLRSTIGGPQKSGVVVFGGAQNINMINTRVIIAPTYTTTDLDWLGRAGYPHANWASGVDGYFYAGLSGKVESVIGGWGRNWYFNNLALDGTTESFWNLHRPNALGDIASSQPTQTVTTELVQQIVMTNFRHVRSNGVAMDYAFKCGASVNNSRISARLEFTRFAAFGTGVVHANASALTGIDLCLIDNGGLRMSGTPAEWTTFGNAAPTSPQKNFLLGGMDFFGGYSGTGTKRGITISGTDGIMRQSAAVTTASTMQAFYNPNGLVGQIQCTASATAYSTSSDETLKDFIGEYEAEKAYEIIKALPVQKFTWKADGNEAIGWGAQTAHAVSKDLGLLGFWFNPLNGEHCHETDKFIVHTEEGGVSEVIEAQYMPAGIDQSKYTPYLWAATSKMIDEIELLKNEIQSLKKLI